MCSPRGSANKLLLPSARGPNSALPLATPTILPSNNSFNNSTSGYCPGMLYPKYGLSHLNLLPYANAAAPKLLPASPGLGIIQISLQFFAIFELATQFNATPPM